MKNILKKGGFLFILLCIALIINNRMGYITIIGLFLISVCWKIITTKTRLESDWIVLIFYCLSYIIISAINGFNYSPGTLLLLLVAPPLFYYYGKTIPSFCNNERELILVWLIILFCYAIDTIIVGIDSMVVTGERFNTERNLMFYEGQDTSATQIGLALNVCMIGMPMALIISDKWLKIPYTLLTILSLLVVTYLLNRTGLVIFMLCLACILFFKTIHSKTYTIISILLILGVILFLQFSDFADSELYQLYDERNKTEGLEARSDRWIQHIENLLIYPFGWAKNGSIYYIHNMWLDIARVSGILPFILLCWLTIKYAIKAVRDVIRYKTECSYLMLSLNICFFLSCFVEPIYGGTHFMLYCLLWGSQSAWNKKYKLISRY